MLFECMAVHRFSIQMFRLPGIILVALLIAGCPKMAPPAGLNTISKLATNAGVERYVPHSLELFSAALLDVLDERKDDVRRVEKWNRTQTIYFVTDASFMGGFGEVGRIHLEPSGSNGTTAHLSGRHRQGTDELNATLEAQWMRDIIEVAATRLRGNFASYNTSKPGRVEAKNFRALSAMHTDGDRAGLAFLVGGLGGVLARSEYRGLDTEFADRIAFEYTIRYANGDTQEVTSQSAAFITQCVQAKEIQAAPKNEEESNEVAVDTEPQLVILIPSAKCAFGETVPEPVKIAKRQNLDGPPIIDQHPGQKGFYRLGNSEIEALFSDTRIDEYPDSWVIEFQPGGKWEGMWAGPRTVFGYGTWAVRNQLHCLDILDHDGLAYESPDDGRCYEVWVNEETGVIRFTDPHRQSFRVVVKRNAFGDFSKLSSTPR